MPITWKDPVKAPEAKQVILGYLEAFDPDILVQFSESVPDFVANLGLRVIKPSGYLGRIESRGKPVAKIRDRHFRATGRHF
jgi:hypothetical protein